MDLIQSMEIYRRVVEAGSFSAVAKEQSLSQPSISKHIAALEKRLGIKLLNRSTRQLNLTEAGANYYRHCLQILEEIEKAEAHIRQTQLHPQGTLRISTPMTFGRLFIVPHLWDFMNLYPDLKIDLISDDNYIDLVKEGVDVAIRVGPLQDSSYVAKPLGFSPLVMVASPDYLARRGKPTSIQDLSQHDCLVYSLLSEQNSWHFSSINGEEKVNVSGKFITNTPDAMHAAALAGMGIAIISWWAAKEEIKAEQLQVILPDHLPKAMDIHAIFQQRRYVSQKVKLFIEYMSAIFKNKTQTYSR